MPPEQSTKTSQWAAFVPPGRGKQWPWKTGKISALAILLFSLLAAATVMWGIQHFENRLDKSARADLATAGVNLDTLDFDWTYRDLSLTGEVSKELSEQQIIDILRASDDAGIRNISLQLTPLPEQPLPGEEKGTIDVTATLAEGILFLEGSVLTAAHRTRLYEAATQAVGQSNVVRKITVSGLLEAIPGADQRIESFANSIAGLDKATAADAALSATDFRFNATVADENQVDELLARQGSAGDVGLVISGDIVAKKSAPGGVVDVNALKNGERITLSGVVISDFQKQLLVDAATTAVGESMVDDQVTVVASGDDTSLADDKITLLATAVETFPTAIEASARVTVTDFEFNALVEFEEDTAPLISIREKASENGLEVNGEIEARRISLEREVLLLQAEIDALSAEIRENVIFESSEWVLGFDAKKTLDKVVDAMNRHQRPVVLIAGHTDSSGARIDNELLSLERASAVREYLEISGINQLRLRSVGYGEGVPIASNDTEVGKKQNRRVEFSARGRFDN